MPMPAASYATATKQATTATTALDSPVSTSASTLSFSSITKSGEASYPTSARAASTCPSGQSTNGTTVFTSSISSRCSICSSLDKYQPDRLDVLSTKLSETILEYDTGI